MARLNDNEVREIARMQRVIDTLELAIVALGRLADGIEQPVAMQFEWWDELESIEQFYVKAYQKLSELNDDTTTAKED